MEEQNIIAVQVIICYTDITDRDKFAMSICLNTGRVLILPRHCEVVFQLLVVIRYSHNPSNPVDISLISAACVSTMDMYQTTFNATLLLTVGDFKCDSGLVTAWSHFHPENNKASIADMLSLFLSCINTPKHCINFEILPRVLICYFN